MSDNARPGFVGIDVGGERKGFHAALVCPGEDEVRSLCRAPDAAAIVDWITDEGITPAVIAIDCPPRCQRAGSETRLAERELCRLGFRLQWTRSPAHPPAEWMVNGERLWTELRLWFPEAALIECFPTAAGSALGASPLRVSLAAFGPHHASREWKDLLDACICADVARRYAQGSARIAGEGDELGPIYF